MNAPTAFPLTTALDNLFNHCYLHLTRCLARLLLHIAHAVVAIRGEAGTLTDTKIEGGTPDLIETVITTAGTDNAQAMADLSIVTTDAGTGVGVEVEAGVVAGLGILGVGTIDTTCRLNGLDHPSSRLGR